MRKLEQTNRCKGKKEY